jgi:hypothetical protein
MNIYEQKSTETTMVTKTELMCEICNYKCSDSSNFKKHINTKKHKTRICEQKINTDEQNYTKTTENVHICKICNKVYKNRNGLWYHKKKCIKEPVENIYNKNGNDVIELLIHEHKDFKNIILELVKSNVNLQKQVMDVCKNGNGMNNSHNTNNSYNKTFNLHFFLNEQCKDAMNMADFVNSMTLELSDLEDVGKLGYVEGISNIIIRNLNALDIYKRPIHCSDAKREIIYVKDDNVWEKENNTYDKLRKAVKSVTYKNSALLIPWSKAHPACMNTQHHLNDVYVKLMGQAMGGKEEFVDSENKIMKKIAKAVLIDKAC